MNGFSQIAGADIVTVLQTALAPAFLLVGIGAMLNLFAGRLARIIDRSRDLQELFKSTTGVDHDLVVSELGDLQLRIKIVNSAIFLSVISAIIACGLIGLLFIMEMTGANLSLAIAGAFVVAISLLSLALVQFLREVRIGIPPFACEYNTNCCIESFSAVRRSKCESYRKFEQVLKFFILLSQLRVPACAQAAQLRQSSTTRLNSGQAGIASDRRPCRRYWRQNMFADRRLHAGPSWPDRQPNRNATGIIAGQTDHSE